MITRIGFIGAGHLAGYLLEGLRKTRLDLEITLSDCDMARAENLAELSGAHVAPDNQTLADRSELVILAVRPADAVAACEAVAFRAGQKLASTAAGVPLADLAKAAHPAKVVRIMPITSASINLSPTLVYPPDHEIAEVLGLLGQIHNVPSEASFTAASVIAAFYGWVYALADDTVAWTTRQGVPEDVARKLVLETIRSTAEMALTHPELPLQELLHRLATPGGITEYGLTILREGHGLDAWGPALDGVLARMRR